MITRRNALWLIPLALLITFPIWRIPLASYLAPRGGYDPDFTKKKEVKHNFSMFGVTIKQADQGKETADITAQQARSSNKPNVYILEDVVANVVNDNGSITNIEAGTGNYNTEKKRLKLKGNVIITNTSENYQMRTELLYYDGVKRTIHSPVGTKLTGDGIRIDGSSFRHDMNTGTYSVGGRVHSTIVGYEGL